MHKAHIVCLICSFCPGSDAACPAGRQRVHLDISVGDQAVDYAVVAKREKLTELQLRVRQLLDQVEQISKEQNYQRVSGRVPALVAAADGAPVTVLVGGGALSALIVVRLCSRSIRSCGTATGERDSIQMARPSELAGLIISANARTNCSFGLMQ